MAFIGEHVEVVFKASPRYDGLKVSALEKCRFYSYMMNVFTHCFSGCANKTTVAQVRSQKHSILSGVGLVLRSFTKRNF